MATKTTTGKRASGVGTVETILLVLFVAVFFSLLFSPTLQKGNTPLFSSSDSAMPGPTGLAVASSSLQGTDICIDIGHRCVQVGCAQSGTSATDSGKTVGEYELLKSFGERLKGRLVAMGYSVDMPTSSEVVAATRTLWERQGNCRVIVSLHADMNRQTGMQMITCDEQKDTRTDGGPFQDEPYYCIHQGVQCDQGLEPILSVLDPKRLSHGNIQYSVVTKNGEDIRLASAIEKEVQATGIIKILGRTLDTSSVEGRGMSSLGIVCKTKEPAVLIELGSFGGGNGASKGTDFDTLMDQDNQQKIAEAVAAGITQYLGAPPSPPQLSAAQPSASSGSGGCPPGYEPLRGPGLLATLKGVVVGDAQQVYAAFVSIFSDNSFKSQLGGTMCAKAVRLSMCSFCEEKGCPGVSKANNCISSGAYTFGDETGIADDAWDMRFLVEKRGGQVIPVETKEQCETRKRILAKWGSSQTTLNSMACSDSNPLWDSMIPAGMPVAVGLWNTGTSHEADAARRGTYTHVMVAVRDGSGNIQFCQDWGSQTGCTDATAWFQRYPSTHVVELLIPYYQKTILADAQATTSSTSPASALSSSPQASQQGAVSEDVAVYTSVDQAIKNIDYTYLISDAEFTDVSKVTQQEIQAFLEKKGSFLKNPLDGVLFSEEIVRLARQNNINPLLIMVRAQVEQGAITRKAVTKQRQVDYLLGCGATDSGDIPRYKGISSQIQCSIDTHKRWFDDGKTKQFPLSMNLRDCNGQKQLSVKNAATYSLYKYTPWLYDTCSNGFGGGNYLFYTTYVKYLEEIKGSVALSGGSASSKDVIYLADGTICVRAGSQAAVETLRNALEVARRTGAKTGEYYITPSFKVNLNYNFSIYSHIKGVIDANNPDNILTNCTAKDVRVCAEDYITSLNEKNKLNNLTYEWKMDDECSTGTDHIDQAQSFLGYFLDCYDADANNCYCEIPQTELKNYLLKFERIDATDEQSPYQASIIQQYGTTAGISGRNIYTFEDYTFDGPLCNIYETTGFLGFFKTHAIFNRGNIVVQPRYSPVDTYELGFPGALQLDKNVGDTVRLLKYTDDEGKKQMCFSAYDNKQSLITSAKDVLGVQSIGECGKAYQKVRFCVKDTSRNIMHYDAEKDQVFLDNPEVRFALTFRNREPPEALGKPAVYNSNRDEGTALVVFDAVPDITTYAVYALGSSQFSGDTVFTRSMKRYELKDEEDLGETNSFDYLNPVFERDAEGQMQRYYTFNGEKIILEKNKLYHYTLPDPTDPDKKTEKYLAFISGLLDSNSQNTAVREDAYYICVNAVDDNNNEQSECSLADTAKSQLVKVSLTDTLPAAPFPELRLESFLEGVNLEWDFIDQNEDGSPLALDRLYGAVTLKLFFKNKQDAETMSTMTTFKKFKPEAEKLGLSFVHPLESTGLNEDPEMHIEEEILDINYDSFRFTNTEPGYYLFAACILDYAENCHMTYSDIIDLNNLPKPLDQDDILFT